VLDGGRFERPPFAIHEALLMVIVNNATSRSRCSAVNGGADATTFSMYAAIFASCIALRRDTLVFLSRLTAQPVTWGDRLSLFLPVITAGRR
jgi:hypothetical protein